MDAAGEAGGIPRVSTSFSLGVENEQVRLTRDWTAELSRETKLSDANGARGNVLFPVQLTTTRIGNLSPG